MCKHTEVLFILFLPLVMEENIHIMADLIASNSRTQWILKISFSGFAGLDKFFMGNRTKADSNKADSQDAVIRRTLFW